MRYRIQDSRRYKSILLSLLFLNSLHGIRATRLGGILTMADFSSALEVMKLEGNKAIIAPQSTAPHLVGLHVPIKLTRNNFLL